MRAAARDDDRVRYQVAMALDQIAADRGQVVQCAQRRDVTPLRRAGGEIAKEAREGVFAGTNEDGVGMRCRLVGQRRDVQSAQCHVGALASVVIRDAIRAIRVRDVDLDHHQIGLIVEVEWLDVLVLQTNVERRIEVRRQGRKTERRKQRVLNGSPVGAGGFGERREDQLHAPQTSKQVVHAATIPQTTLHYKVNQRALLAIEGGEQRYGAAADHRPKFERRFCLAIVRADGELAAVLWPADKVLALAVDGHSYVDYPRSRVEWNGAGRSRLAGNGDLVVARLDSVGHAFAEHVWSAA